VLSADFALTGDGEAEFIKGARTTFDWLPGLGVPLQQGRYFTAEEDTPGNPARVAIIADGLRQRRFGGGNPIGQTVELDDQSFTIVGVTAKYTEFPYNAEVWVPMGLDVNGPLRNNHSLGGFGLTKPGVTFAEVREDLQRIYRELAVEYPDTNKDWGFEVRTLRDNFLHGVKPRLWTLFGVVAFLLLIASANVVNMLLARSQEQIGEITVRLALGADRTQLIRQLLLESLLLALGGGLLGLVLAQLSLSSLRVFAPTGVITSFYSDISLDWRVLGFLLLLCALLGVVCGLIPALRATRPDLQSALKDAGRRTGLGRQGRRLLNGLVIVETAVALMLLVGASLMVDSLRRLQQQSPGFDPKDTLVLRFSLSDNRYRSHPDRLATLESIRQQIAALPGVTASAVGGSLPLTTMISDQRIAAATVEGRPLSSNNDFLILNHRLVSTNYLETLGVPLLAGRYLNTSDQLGSQPVVVVSQRTQELYWPGQSAVGKRIKRGGPESTNPWMTVVGVVADVADQEFGLPTSQQNGTWYLPYTQHDFNRLFLVVRASGPTEALQQPIRQLVRRVDPDMPLYAVETMEARVEQSFRAKRLLTILLTVFAGLGLVLASTGIYGILSYVIGQQKRDLGLRVALGAQAGSVLVRVLGQGLRLAAAGAALGLVGAAVLTRYLSSFSHQLQAGNVAFYIVMALGLFAVALLASYGPARRAMRTDPITALRED
jgi:putative ABC transport system permease protein